MKKRRVSGVTLALLVISLPIVAFNLMPVLLVKGALAADEYTLALWHFNEGKGQLVYDESIHNNDGTLGPTSNVEARDPSWTTGFTGQPVRARFTRRILINKHPETPLTP